MAAIRRLLHVGESEWWALPIVLGGACEWDERSLIESADLLSRAASAGTISPDAADSLALAIDAQPSVASLVALGCGDSEAAQAALGRCSQPEQVRVLQLVARASHASQRRALQHFY